MPRRLVLGTVAGALPPALWERFKDTDSMSGADYAVFIGGVRVTSVRAVRERPVECQRACEADLGCHGFVLVSEVCDTTKQASCAMCQW